MLAWQCARPHHRERQPDVQVSLFFLDATDHHHAESVEILVYR